MKRFPASCKCFDKFWFPNMASGKCCRAASPRLGGLRGAAAGVGPTSSSHKLSGVLAGSLSGRELLVEVLSVSLVILSRPVADWNRYLLPDWTLTTFYLQININIDNGPISETSSRLYCFILSDLCLLTAD